MDFSVAMPKTHLSIMSPLGPALSGLRVGSRMPYVDLDGALRLVTVDAIDVDTSNEAKLAVAICTILLLAAWLAPASFFRP
jgi:hypothetical protein